MIRAEGLTKYYQEKAAVEGVSLSLPEGEVLALLGGSGSGKTTLLRMLNRLVEPDAGQVWVNGENTSSLPGHALRRNMGYVIQETGLFPHLTVAENINTVPALLGWSAQEQKARCEELLCLLGLPPEDFTHRYPEQLSGGQQQRIGIARALAAKPAVLLMDEPFGALDPLIRQRVQEEFRQLQQQLGLTVVLVTHDVEEAFLLGDRLMLLDEGRLQQTGSPRDLLFRPANAYVRHFFDPQRFRLELMVTPLSALLPYLPDSSEQAESDIPPFGESQTLDKVLGSTEGTIVIESKGSRKAYPAPIVWEAFYRFKQEGVSND